MGWHAELQLDYRHEDGVTRAHAMHHGPLRVLKALYPEGPAVCHHVLVHPPAGFVAGDEVSLRLRLAPGSHALLTTPGATRFYRSDGAQATQRTQARLEAGARLEWLPQETIVYRGARAASRLHVELAAGAEMIGWDIVVLGLEAAQAPFDAGQWHQRIELAGLWLDAARIDAGDHVLRRSPLGLGGRCVMASMWWAAGSAPDPARTAAALDAARRVIADHALRAIADPALRATAGPALRAEAQLRAGVTAVHPQVVVLRALAMQGEPLVQLLRAVRRAWRAASWQLAPVDPRVWST